MCLCHAQQRHSVAVIITFTLRSERGFNGLHAGNLVSFSVLKCTHRFSNPLDRDFYNNLKFHFNATAGSFHYMNHICD